MISNHYNQPPIITTDTEQWEYSGVFNSHTSFPASYNLSHLQFSLTIFILRLWNHSRNLDELRSHLLSFLRAEKQCSEKLVIGVTEIYRLKHKPWGDFTPHGWRWGREILVCVVLRRKHASRSFDVWVFAAVCEVCGERSRRVQGLREWEHPWRAGGR